MKEVNRQVWNRFILVAKPFWSADDKVMARSLLLVLLLLMLAVNGLNVAINYVGGDFMTALSSKNAPRYFQMLWIYGGVFVIGTPIVVFYSFVQQKLTVRWRKWLSEDLLKKYLSDRNFYRINHSYDIDNPDERLHQDVNSFCSTALSLFLSVLGAIITLFCFSGILWSISKTLCAVLIVYSVGGTILTVLLGKRLVGLNFAQLRKEADFRYSLVHVRKNAEAIALHQGEEQEGAQIKRRFAEAINNYNVLIGWQRNLGFFTTGYNYLIVIIPSLIIAPLYFAGKIKFGVITQADMAFAQVLASLSLIISSFNELTSFIAVINRLGGFVEALNDTSKLCDEQIGTVHGDAIDLRKVTVRTPDRRQTLVNDLSLRLSNGQGLLILGASGTGKSSVLRSISGLWKTGAGTIFRPELSQMLFLPQRPYMSLGSLRSQMLYPRAETAINDDELMQILEQVNLADLPSKVGGLDAEIDWSEFLSVGEQQRLAFSRVLVHKPRYVVMDEATSGLDRGNEARLYKLLRKTGATFISVGHRTSLFNYHDQALELHSESQWRCGAISEFQTAHEFPVSFNASPHLGAQTSGLSDNHSL